MTSPRGEAIRKVWLDLAEQMDPRHGVLDYLHTNQNKSGICIDSYDEISIQPTRELRAQRLQIFVEQKKCPLELFCEALKYNDTHAHLASALENAISRCQSSQTAPDTVDRETDQVHEPMEIDDEMQDETVEMMEIDDMHVQPGLVSNHILQEPVLANVGTHSFPNIFSYSLVPMVPANISVHYEIRGYADFIYGNVLLIWQGQNNVVKQQMITIVKNISNGDDVSRAPNFLIHTIVD